MIVVRVELHSAVTRQVTELARMHICNTGLRASNTVADYEGSTLRGRSAADLDKGNVTRNGKVLGHRRQALHVWHLVAKMLYAMKYGDNARIRCLNCPLCPQCPEREETP